MDDGDYAGSTAMDFDRLLSRTCSVVNSRPQTLQRQPGEEIPAIPVACWVSARRARTNSLLHSGHCRWII